LVADFGEAEAVEGGDRLGKDAENVLDVVNLVLFTGEGEEEVAEDFPVVVSLARWFDSAV
jgi:sulfopyruvate decarboxylase TPP-binding subunit